ncbi:MAG: hypothetical protein ABII74_02890 [Elusimicrobiota bacterium]
MPKKKKPYKKPEIISEKILETTALACGKCWSVPPISQSACNSRKRLS